MTWLRAHVVLAWLASVAVSATGGMLWGVHHRPQPAVELHQETARKDDSSATTNSKLQLGRRDITITLPAADVGGWAAPWDRLQPAPRARPAPPAALQQASSTSCPEAMATIRIHEGPALEETHATSTSSSAEVTRTDLHITPAPPPWRAFGFRFDDPLGERKLRLEGGVRVLGPAWGRIGWKPADGLKGISLGADWQW